MKKIVVISLGGSILIPRDTKDKFMVEFRDVLRKHYNNFEFIIICGGGSIARAYQTVLKEEHKSEKELSMAGIRATRMNAQFVMQVFGKEANDKLPPSKEHIKSYLKKNKLVICGSPCGPLRYTQKETSDTTAAKIADYLKAIFINITNVPGLYTADPKINPKAKLISYQSWESFDKRAKAIVYHPGQHFVLDQKAARLIHRKKIPTLILGKDAKNLNRFLSKKKFIGTTIGP